MPELALSATLVSGRRLADSSAPSRASAIRLVGGLAVDELRAGGAASFHEPCRSSSGLSLETRLS